jgi:O-antigen ligase
MLMGLMSLAGIPYFRKKPWSALPYISFVAGLLTSVLSAARGGWFALPLIVLPLFFYRKKISKGEYIALFSFILLLLLIFFSTDIDWVGVQQRLNDIKYDIQQYQTGNAATSIGVRFELWKAALKIFSEHPFFGAGPDLKPLLQQLSSRGELEGAATYYSHVHNEILNVLAIRGVVGLLGLLLLYIAPLMFFLKIFFQGKEINQSYALAGLILVISFISFGFTQVLFTHHLSAGFYSLGIALLAGFCILQEQA